MNFKPTLIAAACALALAACSSPAPEAPADVAAAPTAEPAAPADAATDASAAAGATQPAISARAELAAVQDSGVGGTLEFNLADGGVQVTGTVTGLPAGSTHGFHVHETGDCSAPDATSAGGHFNPDAAPHGDRAAGGAHHAGDMPNLVAGEDGSATVDQFLGGLEIGTGGANDIIGRGLIVHAQADDYATQPTGNAGARIACGVIELATPAPTDASPAGPAPQE